MDRLEGKTALITGGARGQGAAEAALFAEEGANVVLTDVLVDEGERTAAEVGGTFLQHDVTSEEQWAAVVARAVELHGGIDVLINNAGIYITTPLVAGDLGDYRRVIGVNQVGVFLGMREVAPVMIERGGGSIINISSIGGLRGTGVAFGYTASKWAVRGMTKSAAVALGRYGIRVNSVHPGPIETAMLYQNPTVEAGGVDALLQRVPLGRVAEAEEVAKLTLFLASDESSYSTGSEFVIDGGMTA